MGCEVAGIKIDFLGHDGFIITNEQGKRIAIDPYNVSAGVEKADFILITHGHYDHCSVKDISALAKQGTMVIAPPDTQSKLTRIEGIKMELMQIGDILDFGKIVIEAVPAYNIGKDFHPKSEGWLGYVLKMGNVIVYHSGDTDRIPEMQKLSGYGKQGNELIVLLPVSGTYVMSAEEAAEAASMLNPSIAIPMHYGAGVAGTLDDAQRFVKACEQLDVKAMVLEKI